MVLELNTVQTLGLSILVLYLGIFITKKIKVFDKYKIPTPVVGGLIFSLFLSLLFYFTSIEITPNEYLRDFFMVAFFSTIGLSAKIRVILKGGKTLASLMILATLFLFVQNAVGIFVAWSLGIPKAIGLLGGSITLTGGHGTGIAWAGILKKTFNLHLANEITIACATCGLVLGGLIGGPIGAYLIKKFNLKNKNKCLKAGNIDEYIHTESIVDLDGILESIAFISICIIGGDFIHEWLQYIHYGSYGLPKYVSCLFIGIFITNIIDFTKIHNTNEKSLATCSDLSLGLFLSITMMSVKLWDLVDLALPLFILLGTQTIFVILYSIFVVYRFTGKNYDACIITAGYSGLAMGATPTAIANMSALTQRYGYSVIAFIVVPLIGAFFVDIANTLVINLFVGWLA